MRITNNIIRQNALSNMRRGLSQMEDAQQRVSTGLKLMKGSDDPGATSTAMRTRGSIRALDQHHRAIDLAKLHTTAEESALNQLSDILSRVKELGISQTTATASATSRRATRFEVDELLRAAVSLANTKVDGNFLFGGTSPDVQPYTVDDSGTTASFTSTDPTGSLNVEIAANTYLPTSHSGTEIFGTNAGGVLDAIRSLSIAMEANDHQGMKDAVDAVDASFVAVESHLAETGARFNHLEITSANLDAIELNLVMLKSDLEEVDVEEAVTELMSRQTAYQAAMLATSRVMGLTLTDYLR